MPNNHSVNHLPPVLGMTLLQLKKSLEQYNFPSFRAKQISDWLYKKNVSQWEEMTNLSYKERSLLKQHFSIGKYPPAQVVTSTDGTKKYIFTPPQSNYNIEAVFIPARNRNTLCLSSQIGCKMSCQFCMTGKGGFKKHLSACDIINQIVALPEFSQLTNMVFMGMGEPLDNLGEVLSAIEILTSDYGMSWSPTRITVSSIGLLETLPLLLDKTKVHIAISLHTPFPREREKLVPLEKTNPIADTVKLLGQYDWAKQRRLSFEYILFDGLNHSPAHAMAMRELLKGLPCRINLISFHPIPESPLLPASAQNTQNFISLLEQAGFTVTLRVSRGEDIFAACGMLVYTHNTT